MIAQGNTDATWRSVKFGFRVLDLGLGFRGLGFTVLDLGFRV